MEIKKIEIDDVTIFTSPNFREKFKILQCFTTRRGGTSTGCFDSLNTAYHVGDNPINVYENRTKILSLFGYDDSISMVSLSQVHGNDILIIDENYLKNNPKSASDNCMDQDLLFKYYADAIITNIPKIPVMVMGADCNLILITDTKNKIVAAVHAGWKGVLNHIVLNVLESMTNKFNSHLKDIYVFFGPSIRKCCFKVNKDVLDSFLQEFVKVMDYEEFIFKETNADYFFIDLIYIMLNEILKAGILKENISDVGICTCCDNEGLFYSYRKEKNTGRQAGVIMIE
ncbi:MAG: peptidoglycan editing factor PgeF [Actinomycetota bacterium]|nr:peptidoglycan editing factor PgeF [Actinomycetota bacterium]